MADTETLSIRNAKTATCDELAQDAAWFLCCGGGDEWAALPSRLELAHRFGWDRMRSMVFGREYDLHMEIIEAGALANFPANTQSKALQANHSLAA